MLQQLPAPKQAGKGSWHNAGASIGQLGLKQCPHRPSDFRNTEAKQKGKYNVCPDYTQSPGLYKFSPLQHSQLYAWMNGL